MPRSFRSIQKKALAVLRDAVVCSIQDLPRLQNVVSVSVSSFLNFLKKFPVLPEGQPFYILEYEVRGVQLGRYTKKVSDEGVTWIVQRAPADHRKPLARRPPENNINTAAANSRCEPNLSPRQANN